MVGPYSHLVSLLSLDPCMCLDLPGHTITRDASGSNIENPASRFELTTCTNFNQMDPTNHTIVCDCVHVRDYCYTYMYSLLTYSMNTYI